MFTGALRHMATWPTASFEDVVLPNPKFNEYKDENCPDGIAVYCIQTAIWHSFSFAKTVQICSDIFAFVGSFWAVFFCHYFNWIIICTCLG